MSLAEQLIDQIVEGKGAITKLKKLAGPKLTKTQPKEGGTQLVFSGPVPAAVNKEINRMVDSGELTDAGEPHKNTVIVYS